MKINLTEMQKFYLEQQHKVEPNSDISDRIKAVLLSNRGWTYKHIGEALLIHETTVSNHINEYLGTQKLSNASGGSDSKLNETQTHELISHLEKNTYPSTKEIIIYVELVYGIKYSQQGMYDWLINHKFSYKKPKGIPAKHDEQRQEAFVKMYEKLKSSLSPDEIILFMDSVHPTSATKITYGWIRKGIEKLIATTSGHGRVNLTGAIELNTMSIITQDYQAINGNSTVEFLKAIEAKYPTANKIHIIADNARAHTASEVQLFLSDSSAVNRLYLAQVYDIKLPGNSIRLPKKVIDQLKEFMTKEPSLFKNKLILDTPNLTSLALLSALKDVPPHPRIVMHPLPPYSPNLNPAERVWKVTNEIIRNNVVFETCNELKAKLHEFYNNSWDKISESLRSRINDNFQKLKPVF